MEFPISKHWAEFLSEVGCPIIRKAQMQCFKSIRIARLSHELQNEIRDYKEEEENLLKLCVKDWTKEEIEEAKLKSIKS